MLYQAGKVRVTEGVREGMDVSTDHIGRCDMKPQSQHKVIFTQQSLEPARAAFQGHAAACGAIRRVSKTLYVKLTSYDVLKMTVQILQANTFF